MTEPNKPLAAWILQILLVPAAVVAALNIFGLPLGRSLSARMSWITFWLGLTGWLTAALVTLVQRKSLARWLGGAVIGLCTFLGVYGLVVEAESPGWPAWLGAAGVTALGAYWLYAFALSPQAKRYFGLSSPERPH